MDRDGLYKDIEQLLEAQGVDLNDEDVMGALTDLIDAAEAAADQEG